MALHCAVMPFSRVDMPNKPARRLLCAAATADPQLCRQGLHPCGCLPLDGASADRVLCALPLPPLHPALLQAADLAEPNRAGLLQGPCEGT